jgi:uncharacterized integral membrane protein
LNGGFVPKRGNAASQKEGAAPRDRKRDMQLLVVGAVGILLVWFALSNLQKVEIHFWVATAKASLLTVIIISGIFGALIGALVRRRRHGA